MYARETGEAIKDERIRLHRLTSVTRLHTAMMACSLRVDTERLKLLCTKKLASSTIELTYVPSCTWEPRISKHAHTSVISNSRWVRISGTGETIEKGRGRRPNPACSIRSTVVARLPHAQHRSRARAEVNGKGTKRGGRLRRGRSAQWSRRHANREEHGASPQPSRLISERESSQSTQPLKTPNKGAKHVLLSTLRTVR